MFKDKTNGTFRAEQANDAAKVYVQHVKAFRSGLRKNKIPPSLAETTLGSAKRLSNLEKIVGDECLVVMWLFLENCSYARTKELGLPAINSVTQFCRHYVWIKERLDKTVGLEAKVVLMKENIEVDKNGEKTYILRKGIRP